MTTDDTLPTPEEILATHEEIEDAYQMTHTGVRARSPTVKLQRIIEEAEGYDDIFLQAATLLRRLITAHIFEDGNKRTAWVTAREYLAKHDQQPAERTPSAERVLYRIQRYDIEELATWLETGDIDEDRLEP